MDAIDAALVELNNNTDCKLIAHHSHPIPDDLTNSLSSLITPAENEIERMVTMADDDMVIADLNAELRTNCTGVRWIKTRRPDLYKQLTVPTGQEEDIRRVRFGDNM